jgi:hypothetical protein
VILPLPPTQIFKVVETSRSDDRVHLTFEASWPPGSSEFTCGQARLVERLSEHFDLFLMIYPEEGDAPLFKNSHARTLRSFADGRWFSEMVPRAELVDLARNPDLIGLVLYQDEGLLLATPRGAGVRAHALGRLLDHAPDLGTTAYALDHVEFLGYSLCDRYHLVGRDPDQMAWVKKQLP